MNASSKSVNVLPLFFTCGRTLFPAASPPLPGGVLQAAGPGDTPAPSQTPALARRSVTGTTENNKGKG